MAIKVTKKLTQQEVNLPLQKVEPAPKLFDAKKYFNKAAIKLDPLKVQQEMRDE